MTAEIAILNKSAVALAADSAVTISAGSSQEKIFDSADKLFELSNRNAIGVMINNDMNFMEAPLPVLIKRYRSDCPTFDRVEDAAQAFLEYLHKFGAEAPDRVRHQHLRLVVRPLMQRIQDRAQKLFTARFFGDRPEPLEDKPPHESLEEIISQQIRVFTELLNRAPAADFVGGPPAIDENDRAAIREEADGQLTMASPAQRDEITELVIINIGKRGLTGGATGVIVAGFGARELFPTLVSFEVHGMVGGSLKIVRTNVVDIDRNGDRASVLPFAQREMVERFLYGLDDDIERQITNFCKKSVPNIRQRISDQLDMSPEDLAALNTDAEAAEAAFFEGLANESFAAIRTQSQAEIEDMVEFMPKPEMARMAEALVNLTSIKRRVSRGMETVGGPIDVAVISHAEGFVWVKRKHYFPNELNYRFFGRVSGEIEREGNG